jgi:hypothetical protein
LELSDFEESQDLVLFPLLDGISRKRKLKRKEEEEQSNSETSKGSIHIR